MLTSIRSLPTVCLIVPTVCVPTHGPQLKIVQLLDGRVCWRRVESHHATTYLPLTWIPKGGFSTKYMIRMSHRGWGSEGLMGNLTPSDGVGSPQAQTLALLTFIPFSRVMGKNQLSLLTTKYNIKNLIQYYSASRGNCLHAAPTEWHHYSSRAYGFRSGLGASRVLFWNYGNSVSSIYIQIYQSF